MIGRNPVAECPKARIGQPNAPAPDRAQLGARSADHSIFKEGVMKKILAALLCCWCSHALAQSTEELINNSKNSENVTTFGMGYHRNQYSPLTQINKSNVKRLVPVWATSLSNDTGELAQPTIYNGVMYVVNGNWTFALRRRDRQQIWRYTGGIRARRCACREPTASSFEGRRPSTTASFSRVDRLPCSSRSI